MRRELLNGFMVTDLDGGGNKILNAQVEDVPGLVSTDDPRLGDPRNILPGTVSNISVLPRTNGAGANIEQAKLNLNGQIPTAWLGQTAGKAAPGLGPQYLTGRGAANGYAPLDGNGKIPAANIPVTGNPGTVVGLNMIFPPEIPIIPSSAPDNPALTFTAYWAAEPAISWFGHTTDIASPPTNIPRFLRVPFPDVLIPSLDTAKIGSGVIDRSQLPVAVGVGASHAPGAVPDPGSGVPSNGGAGDATDYLARDMTYKPMTAPVSYQPTLPNPSITFMSWYGDQAYIRIYEFTSGSLIFYRLNSTGNFQEAANGVELLLAQGTLVEAYAAKDGYNNSAIVGYVVPHILPPPPA